MLETWRNKNKNNNHFDNPLNSRRIDGGKLKMMKIQKKRDIPTNHSTAITVTFSMFRLSFPRVTNELWSTVLASGWMFQI